MNAANSERLVQHIRRLAGDPPGTPSDGELLRRYRETRDQAAFAMLMRRHGPMVFSVCQSVLRQSQDAEDAFQATFLILMQKAGSIRQQHGLGGWLQRVAYRVALRARANSLRRQTRETQAARSPVAELSCDDLSWRELRSILHAELAALPERFRAPLMLCYLEGLTQEEAARRLGCTAATVKGRLQRSREKLRRRLERRGVALTAALVATLTGQVLAENAIPRLMVTAAATALARAFLRPLLPMKLALLLSLGVVAGGMVLLSPSKPRPLGSGGQQDRSLTVAAPKVVDAHGDPLPDGAVARLGTVRFNHGDGLRSLFFSPDGKTIISEGNGSIRFWDARNGKELDHIRTDKAYFKFPTILLADSKTLISLDEGIGDRDVATFWDLAAKKRIRTQELPVRRRVFSAYHQDSLSSDGKLCVMHMHTPAHVQVSDVTTGKSLYRLANGTKTFLAAAFAGNDHLVTADDKNRIEIWEARTGNLLRQFDHDTPIRFILASPDGRLIATLEQRPEPFGRRVEKPEIVYLWDMSTGKRKHSLSAKPKHWFTNVCFSPDSKSLLTSSRHPGDADEVVLWDSETGRRLLEFDPGSGIDAGIAAFSPDGSRLAAGNPKFALWDLKTGRRLTSEDNRHTRADAVLLSPTGERATLINHNSISSWDATSGRHLHSFDLPRGTTATLHTRSISPDARYAVTFRVEGEDFYLLIWDIAAGKALHTHRFPGGYQQISAAFAPDSSLLATWHPGKQTLIRLWDVRSGKLLRSFEDSKAGWPGRLSFTADNKMLFLAGKHIVGYEVSTGKELFSWRLKPPTNDSRVRTSAVGGAPVRDDDRLGWSTLAASPDGAQIAVLPWPGSTARGSKEDAIALYDARTGKLARRCKGLDTTTPYLKPLAFSTDGQLLASSDSELIHLWEVATGKRIHTFRGHRGQINSLIFNANDRRLASVSSDSTVLIWDVTGQAAKATPLAEAKLKECWNDLAGEDAGCAHQAVWTLIGAPRESIPFLKARLHPVKPVSREQLDRWIQALDADIFEARERAMVELEKLGELAEPALRRVLENKPTLEQRRRIEPILAKLEAASPSGETLRSLRAVRVLEHVGTSEAQRLLRELANGAEGASLTRAAQAALTRLNRHTP